MALAFYVSAPAADAADVARVGVAHLLEGADRLLAARPAHAVHEQRRALVGHLARDGADLLQRSLSMTGMPVRLKREKRLMNAEMGQNRPHHLRKNTSSMTSMAGTNRSDQFKSPAPNRLTSKATAAKVRPTGHTRQNTGNPNTAVVSSAPPSTAWRESKGALRLAW